jgi:hypothetical protein
MHTPHYKNYYYYKEKIYHAGRYITKIIAKKKISKRQETNMKILNMLRDYLNTYPDIRFSQALFNLGIVRMDEKSCNIIDPFYEEPVDVLERVKHNIKKHESIG